METEHENYSRIQNARNCLKPDELTRLASGETRLEVAISRQYGDSISENTVKGIVDSLVVQPESLTTLMGSIDEWPSDSNGWTAFAKEMVTRSDAAQRDIAHKNATAIAQYKREALEALNPQQKINWARSGELDSFLDKQAHAKLEESLNRGW
ncbi:hypothetical protein DS901_06455 [Loktanella sp. D2R18]|uniref:hypothetical protein n=1 Tax=Rhodobacterales TaxID=204455 RepID=UPI000DEA6708|nr:MULTISPECIES: hypothetical protein [Rhodobacterales]MDO6591841.1 hypothetical protein [Yoonia sp. 1_MG-2023]RBW44860.1 hypothetical protein DS901_06455 [Loktanella sp. D2R18]